MNIFHSSRSDRSSHSARSGRLTGLLASAALLATMVGCSEEPSDSSRSTGNDADSGPTVTTELLAFEPETLTVQAGTTVTWQAGDSVGHTVTTGTFAVGGDGLRTEENPDGVIDMPLSPGKEVTFTFDKPGSYSYFCSIHKGMNGEVIVEP